MHARHVLPCAQAHRVSNKPYICTPEPSLDEALCCMPSNADGKVGSTSAHQVDSPCFPTGSPDRPPAIFSMKETIGRLGKTSPAALKGNSPFRGLLRLLPLAGEVFALGLCFGQTGQGACFQSRYDLSEFWPSVGRGVRPSMTLRGMKGGQDTISQAGPEEGDQARKHGQGKLREAMGKDKKMHDY
ncbi:hypothetical protein MGYG_08041 [Nannizzia gypsea CBS 118893]|uniref:Uncharacterized protein n=1 Tax=Arthroderma gypseum (strain ATCC MYA-4604 / CBS 118893) TaxID=535722 RepID=E4V4W1_ARTGP|nr:hypothetical protein MGYG_08041 [Nannizzia gypsea CBS 118893]EFR05035.1 hypothetical protein MGYG_08041 [Nannizzia gypsea CBS 118893]